MSSPKNSSPSGEEFGWLDDDFADAQRYGMEAFKLSSELYAEKVRIESRLLQKQVLQITHPDWTDDQIEAHLTLHEPEIGQSLVIIGADYAAAPTPATPSPARRLRDRLRSFRRRWWQRPER